jgi:hypothetical protein
MFGHGISQGEALHGLALTISRGDLPRSPNESSGRTWQSAPTLTASKPTKIICWVVFVRFALTTAVFFESLAASEPQNSKMQTSDYDDECEPIRERLRIRMPLAAALLTYKRN